MKITDVLKICEANEIIYFEIKNTAPEQCKLNKILQKLSDNVNSFSKLMKIYNNNSGKFKVFLIHNSFKNDDIDKDILKCKTEILSECNK